MTHKPPRNPFIGSGRPKEGGFLATHKQDFNAHHTGTGFRHGADDVDMNASLSAPFDSPTVQGTLEKMTSFIDCLGSGFVTIGDGYTVDCESDVNIGDPGVITLNDAFSVALAKDRLQNGGIILMKAGTYRLSSTITIPAGISVMGEIGGTHIIGETTEQPMFIISASTDRPSLFGSGGTGASETREAVDKVVFFNLNLYDNLDGNVTSGGDAIPTMTTVPMIQCVRGSNFFCDQVTFIGRMGDFLGSGVGRAKTLRAIGFTTPSNDNSVLKVNNCYFDNMGIAIDFSASGSNNSLFVSNCRARCFGSDTLFGAAQDNCFVRFNNGNINCVNNFFLGSGYATVNCFVQTGSSVEHITIVGTTGGSSAVLSTNAFGKLYNRSSTSFNAEVTLSGNSWAGVYDGGMIITVGDGTDSVGNITGRNAIEILRTTKTNGEFITVYVGSGTYNVTSTSGVAIDKMIGVTENSKLPIIRINSSTRVFSFGHHLENLKFTSIGSVINEVSMGYSPGLPTDVVSIVLKNCYFEDSVVKILAPIFFDRTRGIINQCNFIQTGAYDDDTSLIIQDVGDRFEINACDFRGGYALFINNGSSVATNRLSITNCDFVLGASTVLTDVPPSSVFSFVDIGLEDESYVLIDNSKIVVDELFGEVATSIDAGLISLFRNFIEISAGVINIINSQFNGPHQTFSSGGTQYVMPTLSLSPAYSLNFDKNRIIGGALPLQISSDVFEGQDNIDDKRIDITNSVFSMAQSSSRTLTTTMLSIDIDPELKSSVNVSDCVFTSVISGVNDRRPVLHSEHEFSYYNTQGIVQMYVGPAVGVIFDGNRVFGDLMPFGAADGSDPGNLYTNFAGVVIDGYNTISSLFAKRFEPIFIRNNDITVVSSLDSSSTNNIAASLYVVASVSKIINNYLDLFNTGTSFTTATSATFNFASSLFLYAPFINSAPSTSPPISDSLVSGNTISRNGKTRSLDHSHKGASVYVDVTSGSGLFVDNTFTDDTVSGVTGGLATELQFLGPGSVVGSLKPWIVDRNKNYAQSMGFTALDGIVQVFNPTTDNDFAVGTPNSPVPTGHSIRVNENPIFDTWSVLYPATTVSSTNVSTRYTLKLNLNSLLPSGVEIISAFVTIDNTHEFHNSSTTAQSILTLFNGVIRTEQIIGWKTSSHPDIATHDVTHALSAGINFTAGEYIIQPGLVVTLELSISLHDGGINLIHEGDNEVRAIGIIYKW